MRLPLVTKTATASSLPLPVMMVGDRTPISLVSYEELEHPVMLRRVGEDTVLHELQDLLKLLPHRDGLPPHTAPGPLTRKPFSILEIEPIELVPLGSASPPSKIKEEAHARRFRETASVLLLHVVYLRNVDRAADLLDMRADPTHMVPGENETALHAAIGCRGREDNSVTIRMLTLLLAATKPEALVAARTRDRGDTVLHTLAKRRPGLACMVDRIVSLMALGGPAVPASMRISAGMLTGPSALFLTRNRSGESPLVAAIAFAQSASDIDVDAFLRRMRTTPTAAIARREVGALLEAAMMRVLMGGAFRNVVASSASPLLVLAGDVSNASSSSLAPSRGVEQTEALQLFDRLARHAALLPNAVDTPSARLGDTPLLAATRAQHLRGVELCLDLNADPAVRNRMGQNALHLAMASNSVVLVTRIARGFLLLQQRRHHQPNNEDNDNDDDEDVDADAAALRRVTRHYGFFNAVTRSWGVGGVGGETPVHVAVEQRAGLALTCLFRHAREAGIRIDWMRHNRAGYSAFFRAVAMGALEMVACLLHHVQDSDEEDRSRTCTRMVNQQQIALCGTSLHAAVLLFVDAVVVVADLEDRHYYDEEVGPIITERRENEDDDALASSGESCKLALVQTLLHRGANVSEVDGKGNTPLHYAAAMCSATSAATSTEVKLLRLLVSRSDNNEPLYLTSHELPASLHRQQPPPALIERLPPLVPDSPEEKALTPLGLLLQQGAVEAVRCLLDYHPELLSQPCGGALPPLHVAATWARSGATVRLLLEYGAALDAINDLGQNAMHVAALCGNVTALTALFFSPNVSPHQLALAAAMRDHEGRSAEALIQQQLDAGPVGGYHHQRKELTEDEIDDDLDDDEIDLGRMHATLRVDLRAAMARLQAYKRDDDEDDDEDDDDANNNKKRKRDSALTP
jgi:ankyrin repeat protein